MSLPREEVFEYVKIHVQWLALGGNRPPLPPSLFGHPDDTQPTEDQLENMREFTEQFSYACKDLQARLDRMKCTEETT